MQRGFIRLVAMGVPWAEKSAIPRHAEPHRNLLISVCPFSQVSDF
jgi:hypothetical protein